MPAYSGPLNGMDLYVAGLSARRAGSKTFARMAAWGHTIAHLLHWMQIFSSQTGISRAMFRFSHWAVARGHVPSGGNALTGRRSPLPSSMTPDTRFTKSGASGETIGGRRRVEVIFVGTTIFSRFARVPSTAAKLRRTVSSPFLPYVFSIAFLIWVIASSRGKTPEIAKKQVCMIVLIRPPIPRAFATL